MNENVQAALRKRAGGNKSPSKGGQKSGDMRFFTEENSGLKIQPNTVLIISLVYMGIVVLLHIWGKIRGGSAPASE